MFNKILIANRGEIACRVMRTAQRLGVATVAVYSDADSDAMHVSMADEAIHIGPAPSRESYLDGERILQAALRTGANAIHPGYGFLSENAEFAERCAAEGIVFIGPSPEAILAMGSKSAAKRIMAQAGVPLVPGYHGEDQAEEVLHQHANTMGYPVLLKAVAGGGGKGMRQVHDSTQFSEALAAARREALNGFGNDDMLVEKYLIKPRHVEIQVFCDNAGNAVYLFERDCSVQRRHQKVIEEAPAPGMSDTLRSSMGEAAVAAAKAIDYRGAGTVEFLLDADGEFYFMEMNTRLQVEHPVTELVTGQDLVEWQLRVAAGNPLPAAQDDLRLNGHAFEARIYAEDPDKDFLPATGTLSFLQAPLEGPHVRVDTGVRQGDEVSIYYDPMIAKLIVWDEDRDKALARLARALRDYRISGVCTNLDFLYNLATSAPFCNAELDTGFIERHHELIFRDDVKAVKQDLPLAALYLVLEQERKAADKAAASHDPSSPWHATSAWRLNEPHQHNITLRLHEQDYPVTIEQLSSAPRYAIRWGTHATVQATGQLDGNVLRANIDGYQRQATIAEHDGSYSLYTNDGALAFEQVAPDLGVHDSNAGAGGLTAPMNGTVVTLVASPGDTVSAGDTLMVIEAMKMEHSIRAPSAGRISEFYFSPGDLVEGGALLLALDTEE